MYKTQSTSRAGTSNPETYPNSHSAPSPPDAPSPPRPCSASPRSACYAAPARRTPPTPACSPIPPTPRTAAPAAPAPPPPPLPGLDPVAPPRTSSTCPAPTARRPPSPPPCPPARWPPRLPAPSPARRSTPAGGSRTNDWPRRPQRGPRTCGRRARPSARRTGSSSWPRGGGAARERLAGGVVLRPADGGPGLGGRREAEVVEAQRAGRRERPVFCEPGGGRAADA